MAWHEVVQQSRRLQQDDTALAGNINRLTLRRVDYV